MDSPNRFREKRGGVQHGQLAEDETGIKPERRDRVRHNDLLQLSRGKRLVCSASKNSMSGGAIDGNGAAAAARLRGSDDGPAAADQIVDNDRRLPFHFSGDGFAADDSLAAIFLAKGAMHIETDRAAQRLPKFLRSLESADVRRHDDDVSVTNQR